MQYAGYDRILAAGLRDPEVEGRRRALRRWAVFAVAWQAVVIAGVVGYALLTHRAGPAWVAPPIAALLGTALPSQLAAPRPIRAGLAS